MGKIEKILVKNNLPNRDLHNSRVFVDVAENIHFHYREHRIVFSKDEFLSFAKAITDGAEGLKKLVEKGYKEMNNVDTIIVGGSQSKFLPVKEPTKSKYFDNRIQIEKQKDGQCDIIHIHYRDYRLVMCNKETWDIFCKTIIEAHKNMEEEWKK